MRGNYGKARGELCSEVDPVRMCGPALCIDHRGQVRVNRQDMLALSFNPGTWRYIQMDVWQFKASLVYNVSSRPARIVREPLSIKHQE